MEVRALLGAQATGTARPIRMPRWWRPPVRSRGHFWRCTTATRRAASRRGGRLRTGRRRAAGPRTSGATPP